MKARLRNSLLRHAGRGFLFPAVNGNFLSAPDSAALSFPNDIEGIVKLAPYSYTPAAVQVIAAKFDETGNQRSFLFRLNTTGSVGFVISTNGTNEVGFDTNANTALNCAWFKFNRVLATGATNIFKSRNGIDWTNIGSGTISAGNAIFDSTALLTIAALRNAGSAFPFGGRIDYLSLSDTIDGTPAFIYDANDYVSGNSLADKSANRAVITVNRTGLNHTRIAA